MKRYHYDMNMAGGSASYRYKDGKTRALYGWIMPAHAHKPYIYRVLIVYFLMRNQGRRGFFALRGRTQAKELYITSLREIGLVQWTGGLIVYFFPYFASGWSFLYAFGLLSGAGLPFLHGINSSSLTLIYVHARTYINIIYIRNNNLYHYQNVFRNHGRSIQNQTYPAHNKRYRQQNRE